jgi:hypothetical protein
LDPRPGQDAARVALAARPRRSLGSGPTEVVSLPDHKLLLDWPTLEMLLAGAGFDPVENVSAFVRDRHTDGWSPVMDQISLVARAINPA